jgi:archaellum component FlaC
MMQAQENRDQGLDQRLKQVEKSVEQVSTVAAPFPSLTDRTLDQRREQGYRERQQCAQ